MPRYHKTDEWRGYEVPDLAVAGSSYTGEWEDSPAPSHRIKPELERLQGYLKEKGIKSKLETTPSSNVFMQKIWIMVSKTDFKKAGNLSEAWLKKNDSTTRYIHDADLPKGVKKLGKVV